jgi:hypothetical protein
LRPGDPSASVPPRQTDALGACLSRSEAGRRSGFRRPIERRAVTHRTPKAPCEKERRGRSCRRRARQNPATLCCYILRLRRLRSFSAVAARSEAGARQANLPNGGSRSTLAFSSTKGESVQSQRRVPTRRDHSDAEPTVDVESDEALVSGDAGEWALVLA